MPDGMNATPSSKRTLGRYELGEPIGVGGMASVHHAELRGVGGFRRQVAVKVLHPHLRSDPKVVREFLHEARLAARLRHEKIVPVIDVGEDKGGVYLVMEYVDGVTLAELLDPLELHARRRAGLRALVDALEGLHAAHELCGEDGEPLGLVHRDFSPNNVLVDRGGVARLTDFGIARTARGPVLTTQPMIKGTLPYLAPEQVSGAALDRRTDVWAAGAIAFEVLTGRPLQDPEAEPSAVLTRIAAGDHPALDVLAPGLPNALVDAVTWALQVDRGRRCPDADALRRAILEAAGDELASPVEVSEAVGDAAEKAGARVQVPATPAEPMKADRSPTRKRLRWALGATVILGLGVAAATFGHTADDAPAEGSSVSAPAAAPPEAPTAPTPPVEEPTPQAPERAMLEVTSDAPLAWIAIGGEEHDVGGERRVTLAAQSEASELRARSVDGRRASARIEGSRVEVRFPRAAPRPLRSNRPSTGPMESARMGSANSLADNPYAP